MATSSLPNDLTRTIRQYMRMPTKMRERTKKMVITVMIHAKLLSAARFGSMAFAAVDVAAAAAAAAVVVGELMVVVVPL